MFKADLNRSNWRVIRVFIVCLAAMMAGWFMLVG
jgi:hypothetical protein